MSQKCLGRRLGLRHPRTLCRVAICSCLGLGLLLVLYSYPRNIDNVHACNTKGSLHIKANYLWPTNSAASKTDSVLNQLQYIESFANKKLKTILWVGPRTFDPDTTNCPFDRCRFTTNRSEARTADALLITEIGYNGTGEISALLPKPAHQVWIAEHWESPLHNPINTAAVWNLINWTAGYRRDSTIQFSGYFNFALRDVFTSINDYNAPRDFALGKNKKVAMIVSNCADKNGRLTYVAELSKYITVDIYGRCGNLTCGKEAHCFEMLSRDYKFYLAFENSNCVDYITEKLHWNALHHDVLPVVMGARPEDYAEVAPPNSYIHVDDFESPRQLAEYLHVLDNNNTRYNEYFRWKGGTGSYYDSRYVCRLCMMVHERDRQQYVHWYPDYRKWWDDVCLRTPNDKGWMSWRSQER